jgi:hypothetical protein
VPDAGALSPAIWIALAKLISAEYVDGRLATTLRGRAKNAPETSHSRAKKPLNTSALTDSPDT